MVSQSKPSNTLPKSKTIQIRVTQQEFDQLRSEAASRHRTLSNYLYSIIKSRVVDKNKKVSKIL